MSAYLRSAQDNIIKISTDINDRAKNCSIRFALIKYRDHPPQDSTFITEVFPFTDKIARMKKNVDTMAASGGGDGPEAVSAALHEVEVLEWRPNATKVCIFIADAPPHGLGESGDGFPQGCPLGYDPLVICRNLAAKGVVVYAVGVEPVLSTSYKFARDFMMSVASITEGKYLPLGRADVLSQVIVNGALEGINLANLWAELEHSVAEEAAKKGENINATEQVERTRRKMEECKMTVAQVAMQNPYEEGYNPANRDAFATGTTLAEARAKLAPELNEEATKIAQQFSWSKQEVMCAPSAVSMEQCSRAVNATKKSRGLF